MSFLSTKIGKAIIATSTLTGIGCLVANILSPSSFGGAEARESNSSSNSSTPSPTVRETQSGTSASHQSLDSFASHSNPRKVIQPTQYKECQVVLTSTDDIYKVVACKELSSQSPRNLEFWYLFDSKNQTLEKIDGLTTANDTGWKPLENKVTSWKDKQWQGYVGRPSYKNWGRKTVGSLFALKYVSEENSMKFPFFDYLSTFCQGGKLPKYPGLKFPIENCEYFDIPAEQFRNSHLIKPNLTKSFGEERKQCLIGAQKEVDKPLTWQVTDCSIPRSTKK